MQKYVNIMITIYSTLLNVIVNFLEPARTHTLLCREGFLFLPCNN